MYQKMNKLAMLVLGASTLISPYLCAKSVENTYKSMCASCHGDKLTGGMAGSLLDNQWLTDGSDKALANAIKNGLKQGGMPAFGAALSDEEVRTLVVYIRETSSQCQTSTTR